MYLVKSANTVIQTILFYLMEEINISGQPTSPIILQETSLSGIIVCNYAGKVSKVQRLLKYKDILSDHS